jgi:IS5 family transposase
MGIRSERRLCEEVHLNLAYRWFCRLDLTDPVPDHSTFSKNRHGRFRDSDLFRHLFEGVVARCIAEGLVGGERFAVDASLIQADANKQNSTAKDEWDAGAIDPATAPRAVSPSRARVSCAARRRGLRGGKRGTTEIRLALRPRSPMDRGQQGSCLLRLCHQLPDRHRQRGDRRCRGHPGHPSGRGP